MNNGARGRREWVWLLWAADFQLTNPNADGIAFVLQNFAANALGATGAGLVYRGIGTSVAVKFDLYNNAGEGINSTGLYTTASLRRPASEPSP
ncbi:hypothetical protein AYO44_09055 [Planctomycetaceae bacterium SCGC AG-212-F19]|nr:hypothetical protein AYO44_09055 [Planctomycetaceae bacterium SCGC AG-212-F19]